MKEYSVADIVKNIEELGYHVKGANGKPTEEDRGLAIYVKDSSIQFLSWARNTYSLVCSLNLGHENYPINGYWSIIPRCTINTNHVVNNLKKNYNAQITILSSYEEYTRDEPMF